ncbi:MAG: AbrB family transcriptional regulator [Acuticoccus sp.]
MHKVIPVVVTLTTGALGALAFYVLHAPAAFLTGSAIAVTVLVMAGFKAELPAALREPGLSILGLMLGSSVTPGTLSTLATIPAAVAGLVLAAAGATVASYLVLRHLGRWDRVTAFCGSIPGALQTTLIVAHDAGARMDKVVMAQVLRLFILVSLVPLVFGGGDGPGLNLDIDAGHGPLDVVLSVAIALSASFAGRRIGIPVAPLLAPLLVAALLSASGTLTLAVPPWLGGAAFIILGASVATRFGTVRGQDLLPLLMHSLAAFVAAFVVSVAVSTAFSYLLGEPLGAVFLAYAPGGLDAMIALSFLLNYDVAFVTVLQVTRLVSLSVLGTVIAARLRRQPGPRPGARPLQ